MADTSNTLSGHSHEGKGGRVGEWGRARAGEGGGKSQYFLVPIPMQRIVVESRFGENQPTQHHRLGKWEVCGSVWGGI
jgi:hypothetical protein